MDRSYEDNKTITLDKIHGFCIFVTPNKNCKFFASTTNNFINNEILLNDISFTLPFLFNVQIMLSLCSAQYGILSDEGISIRLIFWQSIKSFSLLIGAVVILFLPLEFISIGNSLLNT